LTVRNTHFGVDHTGRHAEFEQEPVTNLTTILPQIFSVWFLGFLLALAFLVLDFDTIAS
jgi:hypothetical protein